MSIDKTQGSIQKVVFPIIVGPMFLGRHFDVTDFLIVIVLFSL